MPITKIEPASGNQRPIIGSQVNQAVRTGTPLEQSFASMLDNQVLTSSDDSVEPGRSQFTATDFSATHSDHTDPNGLVPLGRIDRKTPTISHLLTGNGAHQHDSWDIIFAQANKNKQFTNIQQGTAVYLNPTNNELLWADGQSQPSVVAGPAEPFHPDDVQGAGTVQAVNISAGPIPLGTLDGDNPTLSHVLKSNPEYSNKAWDIIFSAVNRNKPYTSLRPGCLVSINPQTLELSFGPQDGRSTPSLSTAKASSNPQTNPAEIIDGQSEQQFSEKLAKSVKAYLGLPYQEIDCYGLVVKGLKDQGVQYGGSGGLRNRLERMAALHGLPQNAYQNGEGLIEIAGNKLFDKSFVRVQDAERQAAKVMEQLHPLLQEGMLLSFSTPSRGHTGVIAKKDGQWTYVNSGVIDHQVNGGEISKRVGEERLEEEITNWFMLAKNEQTSLKVSAGLFDTQKLMTKDGLLANNKSKDQDMI